MADPRALLRLGLVVVAVIVGYTVLRPKSTEPDRRAGAPAAPTTRVLDSASILRDADRAESYLQSVYDESNIDVRLLLLPSVEGRIEDYAREAARQMGVGQESGRRGLLFVYDAAGKRLRIEIGPHLEGIITDHFAGYLMREHVRDFAAAGNLGLGFRLTLFMVQRRIREAVMGLEYDPRAVQFVREPHRLAAGGGASASLPVGADPTLFQRRTADSAMRAYFVPQPDVAAAYDRYLEWLATDAFAWDVDLFTVGSREYLARLPLTRAYGDYILFGMFGKRHEIVERDNLAMIYYTGTPFISPNFFVLSDRGWQVDIRAEVRNSQEWVASPMTWTMVRTEDEYTRRFRDLYQTVHGAIRIKYGDNRPLPTNR